MGKPSSTQLSRKSSTHSVSANMSKEKMTPKISKKSRQRRKKNRLKTQQCIYKLFNHLRDTSQNISQSNFNTNVMNTSVINIDDTENTVLEQDSSEIEMIQSNPAESTMIVIPDDETPTNACSTPIHKFSPTLHHSTPKRNSKFDELLLAQSRNSINLQNNVEEINLTREINRDSYLTIDLTTETVQNKTDPTVIDLADTTDDVTVVAQTSNASTMSGDSEVTILKQPLSKRMKKFTNGIASLNANEKGKLLELITETIFNGCSVPTNVKNSLVNIQKSLPRTPDTAEDTYIKDVILSGKASNESIGSNVYHPNKQRGTRTGPRMVVIDGSNVAMEHGRGQVFSVRGLQICIDYFLRKGHVVKAFVPRFRCKHGRSSDGRLLDYLERKGLVIYTPSREIKGRTVTPYDDRYIIQCAAEYDAVVVTGDNYRDLINENPRWRFVIENRLLPFTWVDDMIMFPKDPLGRNGPSLRQFLRHPNS